MFRSLINESPQRFNQDRDNGIENLEETNSTRITTINLNLNDIVQLFYPYVEMTDRFKRILATHSYLNHFMLNYESLFTKEASCEPENSNQDEGNEGKKFRFFGRKTSAKKINNKKG